MKYIYLSVSLLLLLSSLKAQNEVPSSFFPPKMILKYSPINLLDFNTPGITFSLEHYLTENHYLHHEISFLSDLGYTRYEEQPLIGVRLRTGYRVYYRELYDDGPSNPFLEVLIKYKHTYQKKTSTYSRFDGLFFEDITTRIRTTSMGIYVAWGQQYYLSPRLTIEWGTTLGLRFLNKASLDVPPDAERPLLTFDLEDGNHTFPSTFLLFKVGYVLK